MTYRLVIHDDAIHSFDYVIEIFVRVLGVGHREAFELAAKIHEEGEASVSFYELAHVRETEERLLSGGPDRGVPSSDASLAVTVEELDGYRTKVLSRGRVGQRGYEPLDEKTVAGLHAASQQLYGRSALRAARRGCPIECPPGAFLLLMIIAALFVAMLAML